ncbi:MAG: hypothetical protein M3364_07625 [Actinomycetota bacterium]|nr:hypothetical protein [Actinomycetota bacterium]
MTITSWRPFNCASAPSTASFRRRTVSAWRASSQRLQERIASVAIPFAFAGRMFVTVIASGSAAEAVVGASYSLSVPRPSSLLLTPLLSVVQGQHFAWALARTKGLDPDEPRGLANVTLAR